VNRRIAPEKSGLQYANYLDPETLFKLETALKNKGKAPMNHENTSLEKPLDIPRKSAGNERREEAKNSSEPPLRKVRHRKLSSHDPEEEMKVRGIQRIYGNRSRSPEFQPVKIKHAPTRKLKSRINLRDENIAGLSYFPGELSRVSRSAANTPIEIPQEVSDKIARMKREENITNNTSYFPRTQFMTKISSQFSKMESQERPTETENINSGDDAYIALLKVQEKIDTSYTLLREKIIQSRGEMTPRGKTQERERPNTVASLNLINVKNITSGLSMNETSNRRKIINQRPYEKKPSIKRVESEGIKDYESEEINRSNKSIIKGRRADFASTPSSEKKDSQPNNLSLNFDELNTTKGTFRKRVLELNQEINKHEIDRLSTPGVERRIIHENLQLDNTSMGMTTPNTDYRGSPENKSDQISPNTEISHQDKGFKKLNLGTTLIPTSINEDILKDVIVPVRKVSFVKATKFDQN